MLAVFLALVGAIAMLVEWELGVVARKGWISSEAWVAENETINTENYKKIRATMKSPIISTAGYEPPPPMPNRSRVLVIGDSFIWGDGHSNINATWWRQLQWELERRGYYGIDVVAAGVPGASTQDELGWLRNSGFVEATRPDLVVIGYVTNDPEIKDETGKDLVVFVAPQVEQDHKETQLFPMLRHEISTRIRRTTISATPYGIWELKILEGENFRRYKSVLKDLSATIREIQIPVFFVTTPNFPNKEHYEERYPPVRKAFQDAGIEFIDLLPHLLECCSSIAATVSWGINPANGHPGQRLTGFFAREVADILETRFQGILGPRSALRPNVAPAINDWMPSWVNPRSTGSNEWTFEFEYPVDAQQLLRMPVGEPHVALNFERPVSIHEIKLITKIAGEFKAWAMVLDDNDNHELTDYRVVGHGAGTEVDMPLPASLSERRITSLRISHPSIGPKPETLVTLDQSAIMSSTGLSFYAMLPEFVAEADNADFPARSAMVLLENGKSLRQSHALHEDIRHLGGGRYSHWNDHILFSSSDGSDPRNNGKRYTVIRPSKQEVTIQVLFNSPPVRP